MSTEPHVDSYTGTRLILFTKKPFEDVLTAARKSCINAPIKSLIGDIASAADLSDNGEQASKRYIVFEFEHWTWYNLYNKQKTPTRIQKLLVANPSALSKVMKIDPAAALRAPIDVLLYEEKDEEGAVIGTKITWCSLPSILGTQKGRDAIAETLKIPDQQLQELIQSWIS